MGENVGESRAREHLARRPEERADPAAPGVADDRKAGTDAPAGRGDDWLRILEHVTEGAVAHLELKELLRDLLGRIREAMGVDNAAVLLLSEDGKDLVVYSARGPEEQVEGKVRVPFGKGVAGTIAARAEPLIVDDLSQVEVENPLLRATVHSLVGVPLLVNRRVIGVIHVDSARPRRFTEEDRRLLQVIASPVALAVEHARLYEAEREATRQLRALQAVSDVALAHVRLGELVRSLLERIQATMEVDNVAILLPAPDGTELTLYSVSGPEAAVMGRVHVPMGEGVAGTIAATRRPLVVENLAAVPVSNPFLREHFRSLLGVPLLVEDRLVGVLHVDTISPRHFTEEETRRLEVMGERIALAIDRASEYEAAEETRAAAEGRAAALEEATRRMDEFLSIASHELRTPLTSLHTNLQLLDYWLRDRQGKRPGEAEGDYLARAVAAAAPLMRRSTVSIARLNRLIEDLLDASRIQQNRLELRLERADLATIAREAVEEQRQAHPKRAIVLDAAPSDEVPVVADVDRIGQVVTNFLANALKYSGPDDPVAVRVEAEAKGDRARVSVRDRGVGIPPEEHERIWERFYRVPGIGHQSGSQVGLGLGLYISRDIVERHHGEVGVGSAPGQGSAFWFALPLATARGAGVHGGAASVPPGGEE